MRRIVLLSALVVAVAASAPAAAQSPAPSPTGSSSDIQFTGPDVAVLLKAIEASKTSPDITIKLEAKVQADMPSYDALVHYAGIDPSGKPVLWVSKSLRESNTKAAGDALSAALALACMDTGFAGPVWKAIYDKVAASDAAMPDSSLNRYVNRLHLTAKIQEIVDGYKPAR